MHEHASCMFDPRSAFPVRLRQKDLPEAMHRSKAAKHSVGGGGLRVPVVKRRYISTAHPPSTGTLLFG